MHKNVKKKHCLSAHIKKQLIHRDSSEQGMTVQLSAIRKLQLSHSIVGFSCFPVQALPRAASIEIAENYEKCVTNILSAHPPETLGKMV